MATLSSLLSLQAPAAASDAALSPAAATATAVQSARPSVDTLPGPVVCVVSQGYAEDPYHPLLVHPCGATIGATPMQHAVWLQREMRGAGPAAGQRAAQAPGSAAVSTTLTSSMDGGCEADRGHPVAAGTGMPCAPLSTQQEQQGQQQQQVRVLPFVDDPTASHVGIMAHTVGLFHPERYVRGEPCVEVVGSPPGGTFATCSQFEKLGGGRMARWYKSIYVVQPLQKIEDWLKSNDLTVRVGKSRTPRKGRAQGEEQQQEQQQQQQQSRKRRPGGAHTGRQRAARSLSGEQETQSHEDTSDSGSDDWAQGRLVGGRAGQYSGRKRVAQGRAGNGGKRQAGLAESCAVMAREGSDVAGGVQAGSGQPSFVALGGDGQGPGLLMQSLAGALQLVTPLAQPPQQLPLPAPQLQQSPHLSQLLTLPHPLIDTLALHGETVPHWDSGEHQGGGAGQLAPGTGPTGGPLPSTYQQHLKAAPQTQPNEQCAHYDHSPQQQQEHQQCHQQSLGPWFVGSCMRGVDSAVPPTAGVSTPFSGSAPRQQLQQTQLLQQHRSAFSSNLQEQPLGRPYTAGARTQTSLSLAHNWPVAAAVLMGPPQAWSGPSPQRSAFNQHPSQLWQQHYHHQPQWQDPPQQLMLQGQQPYSRPLRSVSSSLSSSWYVESCAGPSSSAYGDVPYDTDTPTSAAMPAGPGMAFRRPGAAAYNAPYGAPYPEPAGALPDRPRATMGPQKPPPVYVLVDIPASGGSTWAPALPFPPATAKALRIPLAPNGAAPPPRFWQGHAGQGTTHHPVPYGRNGAVEPPQQPPQHQQQGGPRWAVATGWGEAAHAQGPSTSSQYAAPGPYPQGQDACAGHDRPRLYPGEQQQQWPQPPPLQPLLQPLQPLPLPPPPQQQQQYLAVRAPQPPQAPPPAAAAAGVVLAGEADCDDWHELHDLFDAVDNDVGIPSEMAGGI